MSDLTERPTRLVVLSVGALTTIERMSTISNPHKGRPTPLGIRWPGLIINDVNHPTAISPMVSRATKVWSSDAGSVYRLIGIRKTTPMMKFDQQRPPPHGERQTDPLRCGLGWTATGGCVATAVLTGSSD